MKLQYFAQDDGSYLAVEPNAEGDDYRLVIEIERHQRGAIVRWTAFSSYRPIVSFAHLPRVLAIDVPKGACRAARYKYSHS